MRLSIIIILNSLEDIHPDVTVKTSYFSIQLQRVLVVVVVLISQCCEFTELFNNQIQCWGLLAPETVIERVHWKPSFNLNY